MILVDTSVWIDHFRVGDENLATMLSDGQVLMHDVVLGELCCGNLNDRARTIALLLRLTRVMTAEFKEVMHMVEQHHLFGTGLGWADVHLLASAVLDGSRMWTRDKRLDTTAARLGVSALTST